VLFVLAGVLVIAGGLLLLLSNWPGAREPVPIAAVDTQDVHSLAFLGSSERLILGHHGGILESGDGGRTWFPWGIGSDAMALGVAGGEPVAVAGHDVLALGSPDGRWENIENDLPHNDIHGFARDPLDPNRMWAYLATGGLYESTDGGAHWHEVFGGHTFALVAVARTDATRLIAAEPERGGIVASDDGGRTWNLVGAPPTTPVYSIAAARGGETLLLSGSQGLHRSDDGGRTFSALLDIGRPILAIATIDDGRIVVVATSDRSIYRSDDGGRTWPPAS
jgi:photosystem II stability/assembly factor-like uncharacterized protein